MLTKCSSLVTTKWLHNIVKNGTPKDLRVLDSSWHMPATKRIGRQEYEDKHIPGALFFDISECCDKSSPYSHMLPNTEQFELYISNLGITASTHVIVYDASANSGFFSAPRAWWMFRLFGHEMVSILDGGFTKWCAEEFPTTSEVIKPQKSTFNAKFQHKMVKSYEDTTQNLKDNAYQMMDARGPGRFNGTEPEPRPDVAPGHINGSKNVPHQSIVDKENNCLLDTESLKGVFKEAEIDLSKPLVATCGSGVSACCAAFAAHMCGKEVPVYDGSWTEFYLRSTPEMRVCPSDKKSDK